MIENNGHKNVPLRIFFKSPSSVFKMSNLQIKNGPEVE